MMLIPFTLRKAFTLIEMLVVVSIVLLVLSFTLPAISTMWNQTHVRNAHQKIRNMLKVARRRSENTQHIKYGVLFYVDPVTNREAAVFINGLMYPIAPDERWPDVCDRFTVDADAYRFLMRDVVRISPLEVLDWEIADLLNNDYRTGKQRNFFAIVFQSGHRGYPRPYILHDEDKDKDGIGDTLGLPVGDIVGDYGGPLRDIVLDEKDKRQIIPTDWGFLVYSENSFREFSPDNLDLVSYLPYQLTRFGTTIALGREE